MRERKPIVPKKPDPLPPVTEEMIIKALQISTGIQSDAATILHITPQALSQRISRSKKLKKVRDAIRYEYVDLSMSVIKRELEAGNAQVAMFVMKKLGHLVNWIEKHHIELDHGGGVLVVPGMMDVKEWETKAIEQKRKLLMEGSDANSEDGDHLEDGQDFERVEDENIPRPLKRSVLPWGLMRRNSTENWAN